MNEIQDVIWRLQLGESERRIAKDMNISRLTVREGRQDCKAARILGAWGSTTQ